MSKIKQVIPVPQGRKYYAVYRDENSSSGYWAECLDFLALIKTEYGDLIPEGLSGYMELASDYGNYFGTYSEDALKNELPELWEEIQACGAFQNEPSPWEQLITELRDKLDLQSKQLDLLKEKIAALEKDRSYTAQRDLTNTEKVFGKEAESFNDHVLPLDDEKIGVNSENNCAGISKTQTNNNAKARNIILNDLRLCRGKRMDYRTIKALSASGLETLGDVADKTFDELLQINNIGKSAMNTISAVLRFHGLTLKDEKSAYLKSVANLKKKGKTVTEISDELNISTKLVEKYLKFVWRELRGFNRRSIT